MHSISRDTSSNLATLHRQLRDWCSRRGFRLCDNFVEKLDDEIRALGGLSPESLLHACREVKTAFFKENPIDREEAAQELATVLETPRISPRITKVAGKARADPDTRVDLFLSYHHVDRAFVRRLARAVSGAGYTVWYDRLGLSAGKSFPRVIQDALERTRYIGIVCTAASCERPWVRKEIEAGLVREGNEDREILIPLRLPSCVLPLLLQSKDWADFTGSFEAGLENLLPTLGGGA